MSASNEVLRSALELPHEERAILVRQLLDRLGQRPGEQDGPAAEERLTVEVSERLAAMQSGAVVGIPAGDAFAAVRAELEPR